MAVTKTSKPRSRKSPVAKKSSSPKPRARKAASKKLSDRERYEYIAEAAYYIAEHHGFQPGHDLEYWLEAEKNLRQAGKV